MTLFEADRPLRVAALFSGGASGVRYLADRDPNFGDAYEVVGAVSSTPDASGVDALRDRGIDVEVRDVAAFYEERDAETSDMEVREAFDRGTKALLDQWDPDVVVLSGYMWILTDPVVANFPVLNVHPADLAVTDEDGDRRYVGADPVHDAVTSGAEETRSSVHFVTPDVDAGPILVRSKPFRVHRELVDALQDNDADEAVRDYVDAHQEWMKWEGDGPAYAKALALIAEGRVALDGATVSVDGESGYVDLTAE